MSYQKFTKDIFILGLVQVVTALGGIITLPVITKLLGAEDYGIWTQLMVTIAFIAPFAVMGLPYTLVRFLPGEKDKKQIQDGVWSVFSIILGISVIISLFFVYFSIPISRFFNCSRILVQILPFIIMFLCLNSLFLNVFRAFQQVKEFCFFTIFETVGETALVILTIFLGYKLLGAILSVLVMQFTTFLIMSVLIIKRIGIKFPKFLKIKEYLSFGLPSILGDASYWVVQASDKYFVGFFLGTLYVGYYAPAYTLGGAIIFLTAPLSFLLPAALSKHYDENKIDEVKNYLKYSLKYFLMIAIPAFFGLSILSKQLLTIFSTPQIAEHSYFVVPFVAFSLLLFGAYVVIVQVIILKKKTRIGGVIWLIAAFLNFGLNFIFVPYFGILGAAITTLIAYVFVFIVTWHYCFKKLPFEIDWKIVSKIIFASVVMSLFVIWLKPAGFYSVISTIMLSVLVYGILMFLLKCFGKKELEFLRGLFGELSHL